MNEELKNKLLGIVDWIEETAQKTGEFATEQIPLYINELLTWHFWHSLVFFNFGTISIIFSIIIFKTKETIFRKTREVRSYSRSKMGTTGRTC